MEHIVKSVCFSKLDNQFVGATAEDDVAGLKIRDFLVKNEKESEEALALVGICWTLKERASASTVQQRVAIAGVVVALRPAILILDG